MMPLTLPSAPLQCLELRESLRSVERLAMRGYYHLDYAAFVEVESKGLPK